MLFYDDNMNSSSYPIIIYQYVRKKFLMISLKRWLLISCLLTIISFFYFNHELIPNHFPGWIRLRPKVNFYCFRTITFDDKSIRFVNYKKLFLNQNAKISKNFNDNMMISDDKMFDGKLRLDAKILLFVETQYTRLSRQIIEVLESSRFKYKAELSGRNLPSLIHQEKGRFSIIIFENLQKYFKMNRYNRKILDNYCRKFNIGIIGFTPQKTVVATDETVKDNHNNSLSSSIHKTAEKINENLDNYPIIIKNGYNLKDYQLNPLMTINNVLRITRTSTISLGSLEEDDWFIFEINSKFNDSFIPIAQALPSDFLVDTYPGGYRFHSSSSLNKSNYDKNNDSDDNYYANYRQHLLTTVILDNGSFDGIQRVFFGNGFDFWLHKLIFIDLLSYLSDGKYSLPLQRFIQIDIDDIFVGEKGTRMKKSDVEALIDFQKTIQSFYIPGFKFNVGFSGKYFHRGYPEENQGDDYILKNARNFRWFCHTYSHSQAHLTTNSTIIENELIFNKEFAKANSLPVDNEYVVSPHHSGVYPIHEPLYDAWKKVWNVRVTSTEEYPHLRPAYLRRGFIHKGIMILPRQTCGLYTHTIFIDKYPGGRDKLEKNIFGGDLFYSFVFNPVNIFMTHQSNYANDRLALYAFEAVFKFLQCWTNLRLSTLPPVQMAKKYFQIHPEEKDPIWMNPCEDKRHYNIWSLNKSCNQFPRFLIIGPQKTGSTALHSFLSLHPSLIPSSPSNHTFEEVQFFNGPNYYQGIDWYMNFFPLSNSNNSQSLANITNNTAINTTAHNQKNHFARNPPIYNEESMHFFEKSSTYFDNELVPMRVHALLPHTKIISILIDPKKRAYSWYQHAKAHNISVALEFTFYEVISLNFKDKIMNQTTMKKLRDLRNRCLNPGHYVVHLERWLSYFPPQQIMIIDGDELRYNPISVMDKLQTFLKLNPLIDYQKKLRYEPKKGFYCIINDNNQKSTSTKCLGKGKGRKYPKMDRLSEKYLQNYYRHHNVALAKLLDRLRFKIPAWLKLELSLHNRL